MGARRLSRIGGPSNLLRKSVPPPPGKPAASRSLTTDARAHAGRSASITSKETRMHLELYKALRSLKLDSDQATEVVEAFEEYLAVKIKEATASLEAEVKSTKAELKAQLTAQTWVIGSVGLLLAVIGLAPVFVKLFG
jgi:hypothetical protein